MPDSESSSSNVEKMKKFKDQIATWNNRASMARAQKAFDLEKQALEKKREYENALAKLQEFVIEE